jgi:hypothetical protein
MSNNYILAQSVDDSIIEINDWNSSKKEQKERVHTFFLKHGALKYFTPSAIIHK